LKTIQALCRINNWTIQVLKEKPAQKFLSIENYLFKIAPGRASITLTAVSMEKLFGQPIPRLHDENDAKKAINITNGINFFKKFVFILIYVMI